MNAPLLSDPRVEARAFVRRSVLMLVAVAAIVGGLFAASNPASPLAMRIGLGCGYLAVSAFALVVRRWEGTAGEWGLAAICLIGLAMIAANAFANGWGMNSPGTGAFAIFTFFLAAAVGTRLAVTLALACATVLVTLAWAEHAQWLRGVSALVEVSIQRRLANHLVILSVALAVGLLVTRVFNHYLAGGRERELRFQGLLGIAADLYWEMDADWRLTAIWRRRADRSFVPVPPPLKRPWDLPGVLYEEGALAPHRADLIAHRPFRDLHLRWQLEGGGLRHELISGEPRFDGEGRFLGYWGVSRDITDRVASAEALRRSEAMLSHLFSTSPDVISLTDLESGRYVMANEAFTEITGWTAAETIGRTVHDLGLWEDPQARVEFIRLIKAHGSVRNYTARIRSKDGQPHTLLVSAASFELEGGLYLVYCGRDVTATEQTRLAHEAVLQNATLGIAFTREGRFVQANPALERMLGWPTGTLVGQPGRAVWASDAEYAEVGATIAPPLSRGQPAEFVHELVRRDGTPFWCRMLAQAVDPTHPLRGGTIWIVEDITERRRTEQALAKARDDAEAANRAKTAFLANTSHEIRTPLHGLVGLSRLARRPDVDEGRRRQYLEQIAESAETLSALISDVLDLSKIESGKLEIERVGFDLQAMIESLAQVYGTLGEGRGLAFELDVGPAVPHWVWGDPVRLRQVLTNYLNNALKFTARGHFGLRVGSGRVGRLRFEVHDTGVGITAEARSRLFRPFTQADQSTTRRYGGSGLGLSICQQLAGLMQGEVGVDSEPGRGSCFWVELPLPPAEPREHESGFGALEAPHLAGARVLLVEDNVVNMTIAVAMLEQWGIEVEQAADGAQALAAVAAAAQAGRPFDAVLMDVQMPVMSGYEATRALRERPEGRRLPIVALTAAALTSEREQALQSGMDAFLTKPIDARRLRDTLAALLGRLR